MSAKRKRPLVRLEPIRPNENTTSSVVAFDASGVVLRKYRLDDDAAARRFELVTSTGLSAHDNERQALSAYGNAVALAERKSDAARAAIRAATRETKRPR